MSCHVTARHDAWYDIFLCCFPTLLVPTLRSQSRICGFNVASVFCSVRLIDPFSTVPSCLITVRTNTARLCCAGFPTLVIIHSRASRASHVHAAPGAWCLNVRMNQVGITLRNASKGAQPLPTLILKALDKDDGGGFAWTSYDTGSVVNPFRPEHVHVLSLTHSLAVTGKVLVAAVEAFPRFSEGLQYLKVGIAVVWCCRFGCRDEGWFLGRGAKFGQGCGARLTASFCSAAVGQSLVYGMRYANFSAVVVVGGLM